MRTVRHKDDSGHVLYRYPYFESLSDCDERIVCLSERSFSIILNALEFADKMRTRVYNTQTDDYYQTVGDEEWSNFQYWVSTVRTELGSYLMCNEKLERIAVALETMVQSADEQTVNLADVFEALGISPSESEADILEALDYLLNFPGLPSAPKLPLGQWISAYFESRYKSAHLQLLRDMSISQRGMAVAQGGVDFASLYDTMGETADSLLVSAGYAGKAYWLWRWIDNDELPGWLGWLSTISGLVLGSIRGAAYDIVEAIEDIGESISGSISEQTLTAIVNCNSCTASEINEHLQPDGQPFYVTVDEDASWPNPASPPTSGDTTWNTPPTETDYKCQAARYIVDWLQAFYGHSEWNLSTDDNLITLADKFAAVLASIPPIGAFLNGLSSIIGLTLAYLSGGSTDIFTTVNTKITDREEDLVCALYDAATASDAKDAFLAIMDEEDINSLARSGLSVFLSMNNVMGILFYEPEAIAEEIAFKDDNCPCGDCPGELTEMWEVCQSASFSPGATITATTGSTCGISGTGNYRVYVKFNFDGADYIGPEVNPVVTLVSGAIEGGGFTSTGTPVPGWGYYNQAGDVWAEFEEQQTDQCAGFMLILSQSPFSVSIET